MKREARAFKVAPTKAEDEKTCRTHKRHIPRRAKTRVLMYRREQTLHQNVTRERGHPRACYFFDLPTIQDMVGQDRDGIATFLYPPRHTIEIGETELGEPSF